MRLWVAQIVSSAGSRVTGLALPLTAVLLLQATPAQMAVLGVAAQLPNFLFGLFAGVWVDRRRRRPVLVGSDLARALLLATIPAAALFGHISFVQLWLVAFAVAALSMTFQLASVAILPSLVPHDQLVEANSRLSTSDAVLSIAGPGLAGGLIQLTSAPKAILADAASYLLSALALFGIGSNERIAASATPRQTVWADIVEGVHALQQTPTLRALTVFLAVGMIGWAAQGAVSLIFLVRNLGFSPATLGLIGACDGVAALTASASIGRITHRIGIGQTVILGSALGIVTDLLLPLAAFVPGQVSLPVIIVAKMVAGVSVVCTTVPALSLRQAVTPPHLLARVTATRRFVIFAAALAGSAAGGYLGTVFGIVPVLFAALPFSLAATLTLVFSDVRHTRTIRA
jgi:hypothetical protein